MARSILLDKKRLRPCAAYLDGEFNEKGVFVGVPAIIGASGVERVVDLDLTAEESAAFAQSVAAVRDLVKEVEEMLNNS